MSRMSICASIALSAQVARPDGGRGAAASADRGPGCRTGSSTATRLAAGRPGRRNANERSHCIRADKPSPPRPTPPLCCGTRRGRRTRSRPLETSTSIHATLDQTRSKAARLCRWLPRTRAPSKRPIPRHAESDHARHAFDPPRSAGLILADRPCAAPSLGINLSTSSHTRRRWAAAEMRASRRAPRPQAWPDRSRRRSQQVAAMRASRCRWSTCLEMLTARSIG
jgi:hypothetical protein